ncbi:non-specific lipid transfer protein GPI-anchored 16-like [Lotus japonicus]|uniref:Bifunctional inhibitor/plant lipid transfer protein/seed storage helical domain-containing protein n=1 Tax=Lotus japonicus TaxID=34305 RepID=I3T3Q2_LOTJA|nr:non-specific lipid transfer protein GPI-anchored 16-like [Lotus japonicus]AFK47144.1 unknown [Lotus japonicus]
MEKLSAFQMRVILIILAALIVSSVKLVHGQISTPCTTALMSTFTPCANIITGSTNNGFAPPSTCCDSLRSLMNTNMDCACLVISANAPLFQLPINQVLALSLSRACNINGIALQCKASGSPLPAPGPAIFGSNNPTLPSSSAAPTFSPQGSETIAEGKAHKYENLQVAQTLVAPASSPVEAESPTRTPGIRPVLTTPHPSASTPSCASLSPFAFTLLAIMVFGI